LLASVVLLFGVLVRGYLRGRRIPLAPLSGFLITVWSWTIYSSIDPVFRYLVPALHLVQYFYFVRLMSRNQARAEEGPPNFGRPVAVRLAVLALSALGLGFLLFRAVPTFLDTAFVSRVRGAAVYEALGDTLTSLHVGPRIPGVTTGCATGRCSRHSSAKFADWSVMFPGLVRGKWPWIAYTPRALEG
jgi:hypothetical protein